MDDMEEKVSRLTDYVQRITYQLKTMETTCVNALSAEVSLQELQVIVFLGKYGPAKMSDIAGDMNASASNLTAIVDRLISKDMAERKRSEKDRRVVFVGLADAGMAVLKAYEGIKRQHSRMLLERLSPEDQDMYLGLVAKIVAVGERNISTVKGDE